MVDVLVGDVGGMGSWNTNSNQLNCWINQEESKSITLAVIKSFFPPTALCPFLAKPSTLPQFPMQQHISNMKSKNKKKAKARQKANALTTRGNKTARGERLKKPKEERDAAQKKNGWKRKEKRKEVKGRSEAFSSLWICQIDKGMENEGGAIA